MLQNGLFYNLNEDGATDDNTNASNVKDKDEIVDLRRQVIFLQGQVDDKERTIQLLQVHFFCKINLNSFFKLPSVSIINY